MDIKSSLPIKIIFILFLVTGLCEAQNITSDTLQKILNNQPTEQPNQRSSVYDRIVQGYSALLHSNFFSASSAEFKGTIFAIEAAFDSTKNIDTTYLKDYFLRNFVFSIGINSKSNQQINGVTPEFKYAIVNNRDRTTVNFGQELKEQLLIINRELKEAIFSFDNDNPDTTELYRRVWSSIDKYNNSQKYSDLDSAIVKYFKKSEFEALDSKVQTQIDSLAKDVDQQAQWTISTFGQFSGNAWDSVYFETDYYHGLFPRTDFSLRVNVYTTHDSTLKTSSLNKDALLISPGIDWVCLQKDTVNLIETNFFFEYTNIFKGWGKNPTNNYDIGLTISPLVGTNLSLPITIKYVPKGGNFLGFLELQWSLKSSSGGSQ